MKISQLKKILMQSWSSETCVHGLKNMWSKENPSLGQCAITSLIVNDFFGGKIMRCMTTSGSHYYNVVDNQIIDLTAEQFLGEIPKYETGEERTREYILSNEDTKQRYEKLLYNLKQATRQIQGKPFKLIDCNGQEYLSSTPGTLGGNKKLKIYGRLDCTSAKRWIEKGHYVTNRVFFKNEEVALAAGYRPCAKCMPKEYKEWKNRQTDNQRVLKYLSYNDLNIDEELQKIENCNSAEIILEPTNKNCLFILGMLFVNGIKLKILNEKELNLEETNKSFSMMPYVWSKIGDENFPLPDYSNIRTEMDKRIENIKRIGVKLTRIDNKPTENKIFLICPVRNATEQQRKWIEDFVITKNDQGFIIHAPHLHTRQSDLFGGFAICTQNAEAVSTSTEIDIYYDQSSTGSVFDLGVAYALKKPLKILNKEEITFNEEDFVDSIIKTWPYNETSKRLVKE